MTKAEEAVHHRALEAIEGWWWKDHVWWADARLVGVSTFGGRIQTRVGPDWWWKDPAPMLRDESAIPSS